MVLELLRPYDFNQVLITVDGVQIGGFGEEGGIEFEMGGDMLEHSVGADGTVFVNRSNDKRVIGTITVMQNTAAATYLGGKMQLQNAAIGPLPTINLFIRNLITGEQIQDPQSVFIQRPAPNQNASSSERAFPILLPYAANKIIYGTITA